MRHSLSLFLVLLTAAPALHAQRLSVPRAVPVQPTAAAPLAMPVNNGTIATLRPGDVFEMRLSGMPAEYAGDFNLQYSVGSEGTVSVPLIGEMRAAGLTASQLERQVESKLVNDKIFTHPTVLINIAQATRYVSISGGVRQPQRLSWSNDLTLSSAIGNCAGLSDFGSPKGIRIIREGKIFGMFNLTELQKDPSKDPKLLPGDQVVVRE
ncbi:polysaccharide export protein [Chthoniobacter flavus Ellin428]|uniref:Polysaccharide export protein n=1 Tax=Chthoniobacter flavus Ellin428 TaxID=497964 RepID=B4DB24_9BACT|nr:polysaccharide biosynthesis/export family protein [Chthoniobacter flavus]EDY16398.1 polysaccharide export protein [Chthoniobacter flavus Ellin428]TCO92486.1 polysaccharide export outer membrane protein [Chthoniobacter flavus]